MGWTWPEIKCLSLWQAAESVPAEGDSCPSLRSLPRVSWHWIRAGSALTRRIGSLATEYTLFPLGTMAIEGMTWGGSGSGSLETLTQRTGTLAAELALSPFSALASEGMTGYDTTAMLRQGMVLWPLTCQLISEARVNPLNLLNGWQCRKACDLAVNVWQETRDQRVFSLNFFV